MLVLQVIDRSEGNGNPEFAVEVPNTYPQSYYPMIMIAVAMAISERVDDPLVFMSALQAGMGAVVEGEEGE